MQTARKILVVDDEPNNIMLLEALLKQLGHTVQGAENAYEALEILDRSFDLVLADVMMPEMNGFEMVGAIRENPETQALPVIMVTTLSEKKDRLKAVEVGANDFITKPVDPLELRVRTNSLLKQKAQQDELNRFQSELNEMVETRTLELHKAFNDLKEANLDAVHRLASAAEYKDNETAAHIDRMSHYSALLAEKISLSADEVDSILHASPMHDVGKIGIPDRILLKPGKLDADEWSIMKRHAEFGYNILANSKSKLLQIAASIALTHHERWDGAGYPGGLAGEDIPIQGRICAVADVFDALTSIRPYKRAFSVEESVAIMKEERGTHFDPDILDAFLAGLDDILAIKERHKDPLE